MKNIGTIAILCTAILFIGLMIGIYIGNATSKNYITLTNDPDTHIPVQSDDAESQSNSDIVKININTATIEELTVLPGIGDTLATRILEYRKENGPFKNIYELQNVKGIGEKRIEELSKYITIE